MAYFNMSTANPTGQKPLNFALGRLGTARRRRMGFYEAANFPLPASTLGENIPRLPRLQISRWSGKDPYGDPTPIYNPLNPIFYQGLGAAPRSISRNGRPIAIGPARATYGPGNNSNLTPQPVTAAGTPITSTSPSGVPTNPWQAYQSWLQQQQQAQSAAAASSAASTPATVAAAAPTSASTSVAASYATDASGNIVNAATGAIVMTAAQATANGVTAAILNSGAAPAAASAPSWFTDPTQDLITGFPNWGLVAGGFLAIWLLKGKK